MKIRMNVFLEPEQKRRLDKWSQATGMPVAETIRRAIDAYFKQQHRHLTQMETLGKSIVKDLDRLERDRK